jgi:hypothetical protein
MEAKMKLGTVSVSVEAGGQVVIDTGNASYDIDTFYSYPGASVGANTANQLSSAAGSEAGWSPQIAEIAPTTIEVTANGNSYSLLRRIQLLPDANGFQIEFEDRLTNLRAKPTGVFVHYALVAPRPFVSDSFASGGAENPTMFLNAGKETLGLLVQDDVSRVHWGGSINKNEADFQIGFPTPYSLGTATFTANPGSGTTLVLNGTTVSFVTSGATGNQVNIGVTLAATLASLAIFLNASNDANISQSTYSVAGDVLTIIDKTTGTAANSFTLSTTVAGCTLSGSALSGTVACIALDVGKSYSIRWRLYILPGRFDYFDFINGVRSEWKSNFTIEGPFEFLDATSPVLQTKQGLTAYLKRKRLGLVGLGPSLDYNPGSLGDVVPRSEYKSIMQKAISELKAVDPTIKCLGCIETDWVTIDPAVLAQNIGFSSTNWTPQIYQNLLSSILSRIPAGFGDGVGLTSAETAIIDQANLPWKDSVWRDLNGNLDMEVYKPAAKWLTTLRVYPKGSRGAGNYQYRFLLENQIKFLLDEIGFDGFYIDDFSQSWGSPSTSFHTFTGWDGLSAYIDQTSAEIVALYIDMGLAGRHARQEICEYALKNEKAVVANSYPASAPEQSLTINRFMETEYVFSGREDPFAVPLGQEPRMIPYLLRSSLASPIGLGIQPGARVSFFGSKISVDGESVNDGETLTLVIGGHTLATSSDSFQSWNVSGGVSVSGSTPATPLTVSGYGSVRENSPAPPPPPDDPSTTDEAQRVMRAVMVLLRHGMIYYHYGLTEIPETGQGSGEYGPINHMFPLTPVAIHKGWIEGKERIIAAIHGTYVLFPPKPNVQPRVLCFDIWGRPITVPVIVSPVRTTGGPAWEVGVRIKDWAEFAIIEYDS